MIYSLPLFFVKKRRMTQGWRSVDEGTEQGILTTEIKNPCEI